MSLLDSLYRRMLLDSLKFGDKATIKKNLTLEKIAWDSLHYMNVSLSNKEGESKHRIMQGQKNIATKIAR